MEYINETESTQKVLVYDDTEFILLELQVGQHLATHLTAVTVVSDIEEAQALFPTKTINDTTAPPDVILPRKYDPDAED